MQEKRKKKCEEFFFSLLNLSLGQQVSKKKKKENKSNLLKNDMKQKLKEKFNVGDKVKKTNFTKCVKMSKEVENLKNGVLNGDSVISNNHIQQQQHTKLNNSNVDSTTKAIVGGRLQFYKGKYRPRYKQKKNKKNFLRLIKKKYF